MTNNASVPAQEEHKGHTINKLTEVESETC